ncbi:hypothetical protein KFE25_003258 [Diacronema lutheri]|uniref:Uncharacterized protein n=4 Tax=Diacronema lutheri TaxID=2081491 RepID=A0A8J6CBZ1_DIALT|nr:hypothetical protein KFE25_003258 [Diacronema lutheri]
MGPRGRCRVAPPLLVLLLHALAGAAAAREQAGGDAPSAYAPRPRAPTLGELPGRAAAARAPLAQIVGGEWRLITIWGAQRSASHADEVLSAGETEARLLRRWQLVTYVCVGLGYALGIGSAVPPIRIAARQILADVFAERGVARTVGLEMARARLEVVGNQAYAMGLIAAVPMLGWLGAKGCLLLCLCVSSCVCWGLAHGGFYALSARPREALTVVAWACLRVCTALTYPSLSPFVRNWYERDKYAKVWGSLLAAARLGSLGFGHWYAIGLERCLAQLPAASAAAAAHAAPPDARRGCWATQLRTEGLMLLATLLVTLFLLRESPYRVPQLRELARARGEQAGADGTPLGATLVALGGSASRAIGAMLAAGLRAPAVAAAAVAAAPAAFGGGGGGGGDASAAADVDAVAPRVCDAAVDARVGAREGGGADGRQGGADVRADDRSARPPSTVPLAADAAVDTAAGVDAPPPPPPPPPPPGQLTADALTPGAAAAAAADPPAAGLGRLPPPPVARDAPHRAARAGGAALLIRSRRLARPSAGALLRKCVRRSHFWLMAGCVAAYTPVVLFASYAAEYIEHIDNQTPAARRALEAMALRARTERRRSSFRRPGALLGSLLKPLGLDGADAGLRPRPPGLSTYAIGGGGHLAYQLSYTFGLLGGAAVYDNISQLQKATLNGCMLLVNVLCFCALALLESGGMSGGGGPGGSGGGAAIVGEGGLSEREMAARTALLGLAGATMAIPSSLPFAMFCMDFGKEGAALVGSVLQAVGGLTASAFFAALPRLRAHHGWLGVHVYLATHSLLVMACMGALMVEDARKFREGYTIAPSLLNQTFVPPLGRTVVGRLPRAGLPRPGRRLYGSGKLMVAHKFEDGWREGTPLGHVWLGKAAGWTRVHFADLNRAIPLELRPQRYGASDLWLLTNATSAPRLLAVGGGGGGGEAPGAPHDDDASARAAGGGGVGPAGARPRKDEAGVEPDASLWSGT